MHALSPFGLRILYVGVCFCENSLIKKMGEGPQQRLDEYVSSSVKERFSRENVRFGGPETRTGSPVQHVKGPLFVIFLYPRHTDLAHRPKRLKHIGVEHLMAEHPIEPFHTGILVRLAWLNIP